MQYMRIMLRLGGLAARRDRRSAAGGRRSRRERPCRRGARGQRGGV